MQITKISFPENILKSVSLTKFEMSHLDKIVIIAGKNGSGKTRVLNSILNFRNELDGLNFKEISRRKDNIRTDETFLYYLVKKKSEHDKETRSISQNMEKIMSQSEYQLNNQKIKQTEEQILKVRGY